ncbi:MAG: hypothetical protein O3A01_00185 [bacterium]|nr:hypothetical protein [bacterium]
MALLLTVMPATHTMAAIHHVPDALVAEQQVFEQRLAENYNAENLFELAMIYAMSGWIELGWDTLKQIPDYDEDYHKTVLSKYGALIQKNPKVWQYHFKIAFGHYFDKNKVEAQNSFQRALELAPKNPWIMGLLGLVVGEQKDYERTIKLAKKALKIEPDGAALHFLLGLAYKETGQYFGMIGQATQVARLKSAEAKYRPVPPQDPKKKSHDK